MKENELTVLKVEPGKAPEETTIPNTLAAMQQMVGGYIEVVYLEDACLVCNEEGKLIGLEGNRRVGNDIIAGTFFLVGDHGDGDFCSLTEQTPPIFQSEHNPEIRTHGRCGAMVVCSLLPVGRLACLKREHSIEGYF